MGWCRSDASSGPLIPYIQLFYGISYTVGELLSYPLIQYRSRSIVRRVTFNALYQNLTWIVVIFLSSLAPIRRADGKSFPPSILCDVVLTPFLDLSGRIPHRRFPEFVSHDEIWSRKCQRTSLRLFFSALNASYTFHREKWSQLERLSKLWDTFSWSRDFHFRYAVFSLSLTWLVELIKGLNFWL